MMEQTRLLYVQSSTASASRACRELRRFQGSDAFMPSGFGDLFLMVLSALFIPRGLYANVRVRPQNKL
ncbi:unnamed protein product [Fusarium graminearum]|nr:unnamed protein product [Fusarium graminearum]CAG1986365.1 unnamed protein product [Fusarium graminearum]CAG1987153.1 unnamed protein product [Fusarium graminearum]VTO89432.1 unnamed protein product [Fusarium graminearum]